ncbi:helix-turn-helix domain-containing protein, partial [Candidatus Methylobacter oryzae]
MKTLNEFLEIVKEKKGFEKDVELANYLGITKASLSIMKKGGGASQETAEKIAKGANVALEEVWLASLIQKEQNPRFKNVLENISKRAGIAASITLGTALILANSSDGKDLDATHSTAKYVYYVKL